jgi:hypothetical protein
MGEALPRRARGALDRALSWRRDRLPKAHFLHISKTGGGAVKAALAAAPSQQYRVLTYDHSVSLADVPAGENAIFFLRDPIERYVSGFNWRLQRWPVKSASHLREAQRAAFAAFPTPDALGVALAEEGGRLHNEALAAMASIGHVRNHYSEWLLSPDYVMSRSDDLLFIGTQEDLNNDFEILKRILALPDDAELPPLNHPKAHRNPPHLDTTLSPIARHALRLWYSEDYVLFETCLRLRDRGVQLHEPAPNLSIPNRAGKQ